jgi:hypothetical protein
VAALCAMLLVAPGAARAQIFSLWPQIQRPAGGSLELNTRDGDKCQHHRGDRPSFSFAGLGGAPDPPVKTDSQDGFGYGDLIDGIGGGVFLSIPFGGGRLGDCRRLLQLQEARAELELARKLLDEGLLEREQYEALGRRLQRGIFNLTEQ